ncbi:BglG family transcription antiterminator [Heyndrickxia sp. NPDC080065]|uniref:BglG family transcription antiterminator n=1 Tax=Heyndrickxia sp. NPDC080065 TaxID=3390568 RepID=UPI003D05957E
MNMLVSARERLILHYLMEDLNKEITIKEIAELIDVSERTIHRDLKNIEPILHQFQLQLVKRAGVGIKLIGDQASLHQLKLAIQKQDYTEYTPDERMIIALCTLLDRNEPIKLLSLANDLGVTTATISNDLDKIEPYIKSFGLTLVRRRGYGVELTGSEESKRKAIGRLISDRFDVPEFLKMVRENIQKKSTNKIDSISERLLGLVKKEKILMIEKLVSNMNDQIPYPLADSSYVGLVVHLALAIERIGRGENITIQGEYLNELRETKEFQIAKKMAASLEEFFDVTIPEEEIGYITMHLLGAKIRFTREIGVQDDNVETVYIVNQLINHVENITHAQLRSDRSLVDGLLAHLQPTLYRLKKNMRISNPLLNQVKSDYADLFHIVQEAVARTLPEMSVPEEEIGYLVLHFGSALNTKEARKKWKALIICSSGIGTSKMLATQIKNHIPSISETKNVSVFELKDIDKEQYDIILSTIPIEDLSNEYLLVSPILTDEELETIQLYINQKGDQYAPTLFKEEESEYQYSIEYDDFKIFVEESTLLIDILDGLEIFMIENDLEIELILEEVCKHLIRKGVIGSVSKVVKALKQRELLGGLGIPGTKLALFHARNDKVFKPAFHIIDLKTPQELKSMDNKTIEAERILLLLAPEEASAEILRITSFISALIIQSAESIQIFETAVKSRLIQYISQQYYISCVQKHKE